MIIYLEKRVLDHPRCQNLLKKLQPESIIECDRYQEVFNRKGQDFRLQKKKPSMILAKKDQGFVHPIPKELTIGFDENYYFSPFLNCPFDCQYCYLQGAFRSANYVLFVNYEDYLSEIEKKIDMARGSVCFFSGYDADSLALEPKSRLMESVLPFFEGKKAFLEIRTKSIFIRPLLERRAMDNVIVAFSLNPQMIIESIEKKTPGLDKRLEAIKKLKEQGWKIGLRFDPVIYCKDFEDIYREFFEKIFSVVEDKDLHSVTLGSFRLPKSYFQVMEKQKNRLLSMIDEKNGIYEMPDHIKDRLLGFCKEQIGQKVNKDKLYCYEKIGTSNRK